MPADATTDPKFDIGHILFIDIVGYSKLNIDEQSILLRELNKIVQGTEQFRRAEVENKLMRLPTGDGMALVFRDSAESPAQSALEISRALRTQGQIPVRMGIHSGPVNEVSDVNNRTNLAGAGINLAQRVMDCGDVGHILLSKHVAEDLEHYGRWQPLLHDLGECEVKHGFRIGIFGLHNNEVGNQRLPEKIRKARAESDKTARVRTRQLMAALLLILIAAGAVFLIYRNRTPRPSAAIPAKSIAVLPFENLSANSENAFFADGVQDEILTDLARIADLKVISRTSVKQYKAGRARNAHAIGQALGVAHLLEGSVQRAGGKVRINAQLIDARNDTHLWAQTYDRDLADVFAIQSEIAKTIADQLQAKLSPSEKAEIERPPTFDNIAFDLYSRAKSLLASAPPVGAEKAHFLQAVDLLTQAVRRDPDFLLAYCQLAYAHGAMYVFNYDHTTARCELLESAVQNAARLRPEAGEVNLARANYFYRCFQDYDRARAELAMAVRALPNNSDVFTLLGSVDRRQGRWEDSSRNLEKALRLDPRNLGLLQQIGATYDYLRRYADEAAVYDRALEVAPDDAVTRLARGYVEVQWRGDLRRWRDAIDAILSKNPKAAEDIATDWFDLSLFERNPGEAARALAAIAADGAGFNAMVFPRAWYEGLAAQLREDAAAARDAFTRARAEAEVATRKQPDYGPSLCILGLIDAALGRKEEALREGRRAVELLPIEKDSINGSHLITYLAVIDAWVGEKNLAIEQLNANFRKPGDGSYGDLRLNPRWDPLRGDPRFEKLVASLAPKD
jgi:serine/threonine-protein kinase